LAAVKQRESSMSTGIGYGIALPHAVTDLVPNLTVVIGRSRKGLPFDALDAKPVHLVVLFLVPQGQFQNHLTLLADIAKLLHRPDFRDDLWDRLM
jgi:mannitol/fructose-specific phosphotransferase system IIA component (Ntr-type)